MAQPSKRSNLPLPEKYALSGSEDSHQISLFMWAAQNKEKYPELRWMFAIPNGGWRHKAEAGKLKAMGVKAGVLDICLPIRRGEWAALWIELKKPADKVNNKRKGANREEQLEYLNHLRSQGHAAMIAVGWEAARDAIIWYLDWKAE